MQLGCHSGNITMAEIIAILLARHLPLNKLYAVEKRSASRQEASCLRFEDLSLLGIPLPF